VWRNVCSKNYYISLNCLGGGEGGGEIRLGVNGIDVRSERIKRYIILQPVVGIVSFKISEEIPNYLDDFVLEERGNYLS